MNNNKLACLVASMWVLVAVVQCTHNCGSNPKMLEQIDAFSNIMLEKKYTLDLDESLRGTMELTDPKYCIQCGPLGEQDVVTLSEQAVSYSWQLAVALEPGVLFNFFGAFYRIRTLVSESAYDHEACAAELAAFAKIEQYYESLASASKLCIKYDPETLDAAELPAKLESGDADVYDEAGLTTQPTVDRLSLNRLKHFNVRNQHLSLKDLLTVDYKPTCFYYSYKPAAGRDGESEKVGRVVLPDGAEQQFDKPQAKAEPKESYRDEREEKHYPTQQEEKYYSADQQEKHYQTDRGEKHYLTQQDEQPYPTKQDKEETHEVQGLDSGKLDQEVLADAERLII